MDDLYEQCINREHTEPRSMEMEVNYLLPMIFQRAEYVLMTKVAHTGLYPLLTLSSVIYKVSVQCKYITS